MAHGHHAAILVKPGGHLCVPLAEPLGGTPMRMRTGKRRSAGVIIPRGLPGILCSLSVLCTMPPVPLCSRHV